MLYQPHGVLVAMTTPMTAEETLDLPGLRAQVDRFLKTRLHGLFCLGTNGEFYTLSYEEKLEVLHAVLAQCAGRLPVCAGVGCVTTAETVRLAQAAQELGADALSVITPFFGEVGEDALIAHYRAVASSVDIGVILYNIPARTGCNISRRVVETLAAVPNIVGIKDSSGNLDNTLHYLEATGREFPVMAGSDSLILSTLQAGGTGAVAGTANLFPNRIADIYNAFQSGDLAKARANQDGIRAMRDCLARDNSSSMVKRTVNLLGWPVGPTRRPFGVGERRDDALRACLKEHYENWD